MDENLSNEEKARRYDELQKRKRFDEERRIRENQAALAKKKRMSNLVWFIVASIVVVFIIIASVSDPAKTPVTEDSSKQALVDSLTQLKADSVAKAQEKQIALLNRPWKVGGFVDDFGDATGEKFIKTSVEGTFSNSATTNSYLMAEVLLKKNAAGIFLHEYNPTGPAQKFIGSVQIQMKNSLNKKLTINSSSEWNQSGGILIKNYIGEYVKDYDFTNFRDFIKKSEGQVKVVIFDDYSSVYNFSIDASGFKEEFSKL